MESHLQNFILKKMPATADNRVLEGKTQRLCPSQTLETLAEHMTNFQGKKCNSVI